MLFKVTYVVGVNSYEGNQYWSFDEHITYENITTVFDITNGYEEGKPTRARRYRYIPKEDQMMIVHKYFEEYKYLLDGDTLEEVSEYSLKLLAGFIYGDLGFRVPSMEQAIIYRKQSVISCPRMCVSGYRFLGIISAVFTQHYAPKVKDKILFIHIS